MNAVNFKDGRPARKIAPSAAPTPLERLLIQWAKDFVSVWMPHSRAQARITNEENCPCRFGRRSICKVLDGGVNPNGKSRPFLESDAIARRGANKQVATLRPKNEGGNMRLPRAPLLLPVDKVVALLSKRKECSQSRLGETRIASGVAFSISGLNNEEPE